MVSQAKSRGFTLVELMIAVAIVAILASVAYPSYLNALIKSRRASAQAVLMEIAQKEQQFLLDNRSYTNNLTLLNVNVPSDVSGFYTVNVTLGTGTAPTFVATATPIAGTRQASDGALAISSDGSKTPSSKW